MISKSTPATIRPASSQELKEWDSIISGFPNSCVFHTRAWIQSIEGFTNARGVYLVYERDGRIVACFPGLICHIGPLRIFGSPREGWQTGSMGPAFDPRLISTEELISPLPSYLRRNLGLLHVEFACRGLDSQPMRRLGFVEEPLPTYVADLPSHADEALRKLDQKTRNQMRKAVKMGLEARVGLTPGFVDHYFEQIALVFSRHGVALPFRRRRVDQLVEHLGKTGHLLPVSVFLADKQTCIATGIFLVANRELFLWGWAHRHEYGSYCPMELLTWTAMERAIKLGCTSFDLFGGGKAKEKYGGARDYGVVRWMHSSLPGLIAGREAAKRMYRRWQKLKGGLLRTSTATRTP